MNPMVHDQPAAEVDPTITQVGSNQTSRTSSSGARTAGSGAVPNEDLSSTP